eukprot:jgi/Mesvir1/15935/Mv26457-RA.1
MACARSGGARPVDACEPGVGGSVGQGAHACRASVWEGCRCKAGGAIWLWGESVRGEWVPVQRGVVVCAVPNHTLPRAEGRRAYAWAMGVWMGNGRVQGPWACGWAMGIFMGHGRVDGRWASSWAMGVWMGNGYVHGPWACGWAMGIFMGHGRVVEGRLALLKLLPHNTRQPIVSPWLAAWWKGVIDVRIPWLGRASVVCLPDAVAFPIIFALRHISNNYCMTFALHHISTCFTAAADTHMQSCPPTPMCSHAHPHPCEAMPTHAHVKPCPPMPM